MATWLKISFRIFFFFKVVNFLIEILVNLKVWPLKIKGHYSFSTTKNLESQNYDHKKIVSMIDTFEHILELYF